MPQAPTITNHNHISFIVYRSGDLGDRQLLLPQAKYVSPESTKHLQLKAIVNREAKPRSKTESSPEAEPEAEIEAGRADGPMKKSAEEDRSADEDFDVVS